MGREGRGRKQAGEEGEERTHTYTAKGGRRKGEGRRKQSMEECVGRCET